MAVAPFDPTRARPMRGVAMRAVYTVFTCPWLTAPRPASHPHDSVIAWMVEPPAVLTKGGNLDLTRSQLARRPIVGCWTI